MNKKSINSQELSLLLEKARPLHVNGKTADYIPALNRVEPSLLGIALAAKNGEIISAGDSKHRFTIQSIVKILIFTLCLLDNDADKVLKKVSLEPTHAEFNSIRELEEKNDKKPLNPMINAGAIVCTSLVGGDTPRDKAERILQFVRELSGDSEIGIDQEVFISEKETGSRNRAITYYMHSTGIIDREIDVEALLSAYFQSCAISVNAEDLAKIALVFACDGVNPVTGKRHIPQEVTRVVKATMTMCGMYNESGKVAASVGLPTKSGVGGGLLSVIPGEMGIGVFGPSLNEAGSSVAGLSLLEEISNLLEASIF